VNLAAILEVMAEAGATPEMMASAARKIAQQDEARRADVREQARIRKQRQRERAKVTEVTEVTRDMAGHSVTERDACDQKTSPLFSPLLPSPKPLTNHPPIIPPTSQILDAREPKSKRAKAIRLSADWILPNEFAEWARDYRDPAFPEKQLSDEEIDREGHNIRDWSANSANGAKADWFAAWRNWIRRAAPTILRARPRANGTPIRAGARVQTRLAPQISQHDAFAVAAAQASGSQRGGGWEPDHGNGARPPSGPPRLEVIDSGDARGADAAYAGGNRGFDSQIVLPLPFAAVR
jgi:hypothetical protein